LLGSVGPIGMVILVVVGVVVAACWAIALLDLIRRDDLSGWWKLLWVIVLFALPILGTVIYFLVAPAAEGGDRAISGFYNKFRPKSMRK